MNPQPQLVKSYTWSKDHMADRWICRETGFVVTGVMLADIDYPGGYQKPDWVKRPEVRALLRLMLNNERKVARQICAHKEKIDVTEFSDANRVYMCHYCGKVFGREPRKSELEVTGKFIKDSEAFLDELKKSSKESAKIIAKADEVLQEVFG